MQPQPRCATLQKLHLGIAVQLGAGGARRLAHGAVQLGRMEPARFLDHHAAMVQVGADLLALALAWHQTHRARPFAKRFDLSPQRTELRRVAGEQETAGAPVVDLEAFARDQVLEVLECVACAVHQRCRRGWRRNDRQGQPSRA